MAENEFGMLLRRHRVAAGLTQEELAGRAELSDRTIRALESGPATRPFRRSVRQLAKALGLEGRAAEEFVAAAPSPSRKASGRRAQSGAPDTAQRTGAADVTGDGRAGYRHGLPLDTAGFTGREAELELIAGQPALRTATGGVVAIQAISGMPGVGKTALAVHAAHRLAASFPDRQLFVDLHGHTPGRNPVGPEEVLAGLLTATGVDPRFLPADLTGRAMLWRDVMAGQRTLLVFDNAASSAQVAPLLPATSGSLVLVTSRRHLADLPGSVMPIPLDTLTPEQARTMFIRLAPRATHADPAAVEEMVGLAGHLPLAISLLARVHARHPSWTLAELTAETRRSVLTLAAEHVSVAPAFEVSWRYLQRSPQRLLALLGLHPGTTTDSYAAAALSGIPVEQAVRLLDELHREGLLTETGYRRYRIHDLIRSYAADQATTTLTGPQAQEAIDRLLDYYTRTAARADALITRHVPLPARSDPDRSDRDSDVDFPAKAAAMAWVRAERANLLACLQYATATADNKRVVALTTAIAWVLQHDGPWAQAIALHAGAADAARALHDRPGLARCLLNLGAARRLSGDYDSAAEAVTGALDIYGDLGDRLGQGGSLRELGHVHVMADDYPAATEAAQQALKFYREIDNEAGQASALILAGSAARRADEFEAATAALTTALGICCRLGDKAAQAEALRQLGDVRRLTGDYHVAVRHLEHAVELSRGVDDRLTQANALTWLACARQLLGDYQTAITDLEQAFNIQKNLGNRNGQANTLALLGDICRATGDYSSARSALEQALTLFRDLGSLAGQASVLGWLGNTQRETGDYSAAAGYLTQGLDLSRRLGDRGGQATGLNNLGALHLAQHETGQARHCHQQALELARRIISSWDEAHALAGLGRCAHADGDTPRARDLLQQAHHIFRQTGAAEAAQIVTELDTIATGLDPISTGGAPRRPGSP
jgi:tetratricopeptide (TPR) repeat protein/transcriptional regulator with XRE-family HTH domain